MPWTSRGGTLSHQNYLIENRENVQRLDKDWKGLSDLAISILIDCVIFLSSFLDDTRMSMSTVSLFSFL